MNELKIITLAYDFTKYITPIVARFPRDQRYQLGERIENIMFDVLENLIEAKYRKDKREILFNANVQLEKLRFFIRLAHELKFINHQRYAYIFEQINQIGIQLGGWLKSSAV
jgi:four helix bundle protein